MKKSFLVIALIAMLALTVGVSVQAQGVTELNIWWAEWDPANYLQQIGNEYEEATGIRVNVVQTPWGSYYDRVATEWAAQGTAFDMVVGDSQWLGQGVTEGHYMDLTEFLVGEGIVDTVTPATLTYYGEYPTGSGNYYAYPTEGDANGWAYRADLFEDPDNMAAFEAEYGYPLAVPETWAQLRDIAEFFTRPDEGLYGIGVYTQIDYDAITMGFENVLFSFGADWKDDDYNVLGVVNSPEAVAALELYRELYTFAPPGTNNAFFAEMNDLFINGQAAMIMNYFAFFPALDNPNINPYRDSTGYFSMPAGPDGQRFAALGGQGTSVNNYISDERKAASLDFLRWFATEEVQARWAELGGYTCNIAVLESEAFLTQTPYNAAFAETMTFVKDFWNIPEFGQLLEVAQRYLHGYIVGGEGDAQDVLDNMAAEMDEILVNAGYLE
ncbi:sugar ABC transporter substrate-binding protein [Anaerolineae bacterium CFX9]|jgi:multiple sugar transport system substrate-binding protein|nr:sugar ABC transporter substrate-binding protein [Kamptonema cortianum]MDL1900621.1 sugar ABC transporter substrate-binding protein [Anaerolineae bacterium CFX9]